MSLPPAPRAQLEPFLEHLLGHLDPGATPVVLVRADPLTVPAEVWVRGRALAVRGSASPLEIRSLVGPPRAAPLVVVTSCDNEALGADLVARAWRRRVHPLDRWSTVCRLFGAERPSRELASHNELADALIDARPVIGYPQVTTKVLDLETAVGALVRSYLDLREDIASLAELLGWASTPAAAHRVTQMRREVLADLRGFLGTQLGSGGGLVLDLLDAVQHQQPSEDLLVLGLAASVIHHRSVDLAGPQVELDHAAGLGGGGRSRPDPAAWRAVGEAAVERIQTASLDQTAVAGWLQRADHLLDRWGAAGAAGLSDLLPSGFTARIHQAALALTAWRAAPTDHNLDAAAVAAIDNAANHRANGADSSRVDRLRMAARLIRRGHLDLEAAGTLPAVLDSYRREGAWLDQARVVVSRGDAEPALAALCAGLTAAADGARLAHGEALARVAATAGRELSDGLGPEGALGVEGVLDAVVAVVGELRPVLVVVLDGMGWPSFTQVGARLADAGWTAYRDPAGRVGRPVVAALPTVTELSRTSLLCGTLRTGDKDSERRAFAAHLGLLRISGTGWPPQLWHKADLRAGGLDVLPAEQVDVIADEANRVVGVVLNNIDERLKDVAQPPAGWGLDELAPLREILDAARLAGRVVVLTADHGHVLERGSELRAGGGAGGGGERWRSAASGPAGEGEILVAGPRVLTDDHQAVLPYHEQVRYGPLRNGYHGGLTLAELAVPLAVLSVDGIEGWSRHSLAPPSWWHPPLLATPWARPPAGQEAPPTLFAVDEVAPRKPGKAPPAKTPVAPSPPSSGLDRVVAALDKRRPPQVRLATEDITRLLAALDAQRGQAIGDTRLAELCGLPPVRIGRFLGQLQQLVNIDGYGVLTVVAGEVRFDRALLDRQLGL